MSRDKRSHSAFRLLPLRSQAPVFAKRAMPFGSTSSAAVHHCRLARAGVLSALVHVALFAVYPAPAFQPPAFANFEPIAVTLSLSEPGPPHRPPRAAPRAVATHTEPERASAHPTTAASSSEADPATPTEEPLIEARADVGALNNPKPPYPLAARRLGIEGIVRLAVLVRADGRCAEVRIEASSGSELLDQSALETVRRWRFLPARRGAQAVDTWVEIPIRFRLDRERNPV
jgi:protein TonB